MAPHLTPAAPPPDFAQRMMPIIRRIAYQIARRLPRHVCVDDLVGAGCEGLVGALARFDPARAEGFESYVELRIRGAMMDELRSRDPLSRDQRMHAKQITAATRAARARLGRAPAADEIASELGIPLETYWERLSAAATDTSGGSRGGDDFDVIAELGDPRAEAADDHVCRQELERSLNQAIAALPKPMQRVLELHYVEGLTLREIGEVFGVSESRVCQIQGEAVRRVRALCAEHIPSALAA